MAPIEWKVPSHGMPSTHAADQVADALLHLARRLVGEGDGEDLARARRGSVARMWAMRVVSTRVLPVPAPASTSSGPVERLDREALLGVELVEVGSGALPAERARGDAARLRRGRAHRRGYGHGTGAVRTSALQVHESQGNTIATDGAARGRRGGPTHSLCGPALTKSCLQTYACIFDLLHSIGV